MSNQTDELICPRCQIGLCQPDQITYVHLYGGALLSVPNMQVYVCDVCGFQEFEETAFEQLEMLMLDNPFAPTEMQFMNQARTLETAEMVEVAKPHRSKP